jgi:hypothetical protein
MKTVDEAYNGYKNYETWNVALWIGNDESLYKQAKKFKHWGYSDFVKFLHEYSVCHHATPDGVEWDDPHLDIEALDKFLSEIGDAS